MKKAGYIALMVLAALLAAAKLGGMLVMLSAGVLGLALLKQLVYAAVCIWGIAWAWKKVRS